MSRPNIHESALALGLGGALISAPDVAEAQGTPFRLERAEPAQHDVSWRGRPVTSHLDKQGFELPWSLSEDGRELYVEVTPGVRIQLHGRFPSTHDYPGPDERHQWHLQVRGATTAAARERDNAALLSLEMPNEHPDGSFTIIARAPEFVGQQSSATISVISPDGKATDLRVTVKAISPDQMPRKGQSAGVVVVPSNGRYQAERIDPTIPLSVFDVGARGMLAMPHSRERGPLPGGEIELNANVTRYLALVAVFGVHQSEAGVILEGDPNLPEQDPGHWDMARFESRTTLNLGAGLQWRPAITDIVSARVAAVLMFGDTLAKTTEDGFRLPNEAGIGVCGYGGADVRFGKDSAWSGGLGVNACASQLRANQARFGPYININHRF